jgi:hypothetical protein
VIVKFIGAPVLDSIALLNIVRVAGERIGFKPTAKTAAN